MLIRSEMPSVSSSSKCYQHLAGCSHLGCLLFSFLSGMNLLGNGITSSSNYLWVESWPEKSSNSKRILKNSGWITAKPSLFFLMIKKFNNSLLQHLMCIKYWRSLLHTCIFFFFYFLLSLNQSSPATVQVPVGPVCNYFTGKDSSRTRNAKDVLDPFLSTSAFSAFRVCHPSFGHAQLLSET